MKKTCVALAGGFLLVTASLGGCGSSGSVGDSGGTPNVRPPGGVAPYTTAAEVEEDEQASSQPLEPSIPMLTTKPPRLGSEPPLVPATQAPPPPPGNLPACKTAQLDVRIIRQLGTSKSGPGVGLAVFTNNATKSCSLSGWPSVGLTRAGTPVGIATTKVNRPRAPVGMALRPDRTAFAGIQWRTCPPTATGCVAVDGFRLGAPGSTTTQATLAGFTSAEQKGFPVSSLVVGSLQPTTTDIVNW